MKKTKPEFDRFARSYEGDINSALLPGAGEGAKYTRIKASHLRHQLGEAFGHDARPVLLDAGCGIGLTDEILKQIFPSLSGLDVSAESLRLARHRNPELRYELSNGTTFPFRDGEFDAVFAISVLHHVPPDRRISFLCEAHRVLRPGGWIFLYEHNPWNPLTRLVVRRCPFDRDAKLLSARECRRALRQGGFVPYGGGSLIFLPLEATAWQAWEARCLSRFPYGAQYFEAGRKSGVEKGGESD